MTAEDWIWRIMDALIQTAFVGFIGWLGYMWLFHHDEVCQKCRTKHKLEELCAGVSHTGAASGEST